MFILLSGTFGSALLGFVTQMLVARALDVAEYGRFAALLAVVNVTATLAGYGVGWFWLQLFGREGWLALRWIVPTIQLIGITSLVGTAVLAGYVICSGDGSVTAAVGVAALLVPILAGQGLLETTASRLQLEERYLALAGWQSLTQLGRSIAAALVVVCGFRDLIHLLAGYAVVGVAMMAASALSLDQMRRGRIRLVGHEPGTGRPQLLGSARLRDAFAGATPYCFCTIFYLVYSQGVVVVVERWLGSEAAAMYNVAFLVIAGVYLIPQVLYMKYLVAKIFRWWTQDRRMFTAVFHVGIAANAILGLLCMIAVMVLAPLVVPILFGSRYAAAVPILVMLSIAIPVRFIQHTYGAVFFSEPHMKRKARYLGAGAAICVAVSLVLIPRFGVQGAAASSVFAEIALLLLYARGAARHIDGIGRGAPFDLAKIRSSLLYIGGAGTPERGGDA
jgi:O-antigen/teichoic acid export membrane protein